MFKSLLPLISAFCLLSSAAADSSGCSTGPFNTSLRVTLWDSFGDGWDDAYWLMRDPAGVLSQDQSTCWNVEKVFLVRPCEHTPPSGLYYMTVNTLDESLPEFWWEIYWKVEVVDQNGTVTGLSYEGVYNTTMIWEYDDVTDEWSLIHYDGIPNFDCDGCSGGACEAKSKPKPKPKSKGKSKKMKGKKGDTESEASSNSTDDGSDGIIKYGPRAFDLEIKMYSEPDAFGFCNGWNDITHIGAHWYIADYTKTVLYDDGSLCEGCSGSCNICLGDGSYVFRVTGSSYNKTGHTYDSWEFCHAKGFFNDQLNFHVKKGKCIPDDLRSVQQICDDQENTTVTVRGTIALSGVSTEFFSSVEENLLRDALIQTVKGWDFSTSSVVILGSSLDTRALTANARALRSFTHDVEFQVRFNAEAFGIDGATYVLVESLVNDMASTIQAAFSSGQLASLISHTSQLANDLALSDCNGGELVKFEIQSIKYAYSHLVYVYSEDEVASTSTSESSSAFGSLEVLSVLGGIVFIAAVVAVVGISKHAFGSNQSYTSVSTEVSTSGSESNPMLNSEIEIPGERSPFANSEDAPKRKIFQTRRV